MPLLQDGTVNMDKMTAVQKNAYLEAHMAVQQHMTQAALQLKASQSSARNEAGSSGNHNSHSSPNVTSTQQYHNNGSTIKVPQISSSSSGGADSTFTAVPDDVGMGYEGGVRVLQSLGNW